MIDYVIADNQLIRESGVVQVDRTDISYGWSLVEQQNIVGKESV